MDSGDSDDDARDEFGGIRAVDLFSQQIWCWGQDIVCAEGNLLVRYGFDRTEKPPNSTAASIYSMDVSPTARVVLRGFGMFYGDSRWGGLFLRRYGFRPELTPAAELASPVWTPDDLPPLTEPRGEDVAKSERLLVELVEWIRRYEVWIVEHIGLEYRTKSLVPWNPKTGIVTPADEMASAWETLATTLAGACLSDVRT